MRQRPLRPVAPRFEARDRDAASVTVAPLLRASSWHAMSQSEASARDDISGLRGARANTARDLTRPENFRVGTVEISRDSTVAQR
jgi:hypothetical protein